MTQASGIGSRAPSKRAAMKRAPLLVAASSSTAPTTTTRMPLARAQPRAETRARRRRTSRAAPWRRRCRGRRARRPAPSVRCAPGCRPARCRCGRAARRCARRRRRRSRRRRCRPRPRTRGRSRPRCICSTSHARRPRLPGARASESRPARESRSTAAARSISARQRSRACLARSRATPMVDLVFVGDHERRQQPQDRRPGRQRDDAVLEHQRLQHRRHLGAQLDGQHQAEAANLAHDRHAVERGAQRRPASSRRAARCARSALRRDRPAAPRGPPRTRAAIRRTCCRARPGRARRGRPSCRRARPSGNPPPSPLARHMMSGSRPACSTANQRPVRPKPVWISSTISSAPRSRHRRCGGVQELRRCRR